MQTSKVKVPSLTQAFRRRLLGSVQSSRGCAGGWGGEADGGVRWHLLLQAVLPVQPSHGPGELSP